MLAEDRSGQGAATSMAIRMNCTGCPLPVQAGRNQQAGVRVLGFLASCRTTPQEQGNFLFKGCEAVHSKIRTHGNNNIACRGELFLVEPKGLPKKPFYAVAPRGGACLALHADTQTAHLHIAGGDNDAEPLAMPPLSFFVDLLKFTIQVQAHLTREAAAAGHRLTAPAACGLSLFFF